MAPLDVLAVGAHPDDIELGCGGTLAKLAALGFRTGALDLTRGELGTRGTPAIRREEAEAAAHVLKLVARRNLELPDARVATDDSSRRALVRVLRELRPALVIAPFHSDAHPDHAYGGRLVKDAIYVAGLRKIEPDLPTHRPRALVFYPSHEEISPSFVVDTSAYYETKLRAVRCYRSQFYDPASTEPETLISSQGFLAAVEVRARYWGQRIGTEFGEPFRIDGIVALDTPMSLLGGKPTESTS